MANKRYKCYNATLSLANGCILCCKHDDEEQIIRGTCNSSSTPRLRQVDDMGQMKPGVHTL
eukprot:scaffold517772_cov23-Prasinocladus_malaysianus.AAC.1